MNLSKPVKTVNNAQAPKDGHDDDLQDLSVVGDPADGARVGAGVVMVKGRVYLLVRQQVSKVAIEDCQDTDEEGDGGHDHLPGLAGAELSVRFEQLA